MLKNLQCDICSKQVQNKLMLHTLKEIYQTKDVVRVCEDCGERLSSKILKEIAEYMSRIEELNIKNKPKPKGFWSRVWLRWFG